MSPQLGSVLGPIPVVMDCCSTSDEPSMYTAPFIPAYVISHTGGVRACQYVDGWSVAVEEGKAEDVGSPSACEPMSVDSEGGLGQY